MPKGEKMNSSKILRFFVLPAFLLSLIIGSASANTLTSNMAESASSDEAQDTLLLKAVVRKQYRGRGIVLPVRQLVAEQNGQLRNERVRKVILRGHSVWGLGTATLVVNGNEIETQFVTRKNSQLAFEMPYYESNVIGRGLQGIKIILNGNIFVKSVGLKVDR